MKRVIKRFAVALILAGFGAEAIANLKVVDFPGAQNTIPYGINNSGEIVGLFYSGNGPSLGFIYHKGQFSRVDVPGARSTIPSGINNKGQVVGWYFPQNGSEGVGFLKTGQSFTSIHYPGALSTTPLGINDAGDIVGEMFLGSAFHGFLYHNGKFTELDVPGNSITIARDINNAGQIVGDSRDSTFRARGFLYAAGSFHSIDIPGSVDTYAFSINEAGQVLASNSNRGFLYTGSTFIPIDPAGIPPNGEPISMNDRGELVGVFRVATERPPPYDPTFHGFLSSIPEPTSLSIAIVGVVALRLVWSRRSYVHQRQAQTLRGFYGRRLER